MCTFSIPSHSEGIAFQRWGACSDHEFDELTLFFLYPKPGSPLFLHRSWERWRDENQPYARQPPGQMSHTGEPFLKLFNKFGFCGEASGNKI